MKKPAIFLDRDNTLIISDGYLGDPAGVKLVAGAAQAVARAHAMGFAVVVVSNQSGVARGMFSEEAVAAVNRRMDQILLRENAAAIIDRHEYCPYHPEARVERYRRESDLRKPKPGMILRAASALNLDLSASWVIGDAARDIEAGHAAGCRTILVNNPELSPSVASKEPSRVDPDETVTTLAEAMDIIEAAGGAAPDDPQHSRLTADIHPSQSHTAGPMPAASPAATSTSVQMDKPQPVIAAQAGVKFPEPESLRSAAMDLSHLEELLQQLLEEVRLPRRAAKRFSFSKLLAGVIQALVLAIAGGSYFYRDQINPQMVLLGAIFLQLFVIALLLMSQDQRE